MNTASSLIGAWLWYFLAMGMSVRAYRFSVFVLVVGALSSAVWFSQAEREREILLENERVRVRKVILRPGVENPVHTHDLPHVGVFIRGGELEFREGDKSEVIQFRDGDVGWREAGVTHSIVNRSDQAVHVVEVELKE